MLPSFKRQEKMIFIFWALKKGREKENITILIASSYKTSNHFKQPRTCASTWKCLFFHLLFFHPLALSPISLNLYILFLFTHTARIWIWDQVNVWQWKSLLFSTKKKDSRKFMQLKLIFLFLSFHDKLVVCNHKKLYFGL